MLVILIGALAAFGLILIWSTLTMSDALARLTASVARIGTDVSTVAAAIRAHPAAEDDSGALNALADQLDTASASLEGLSQPEGEPPAGQDEQPSDANAVDESPPSE